MKERENHMKKMGISILLAIMMIAMIFSSNVFAAGEESQATGSETLGESLGTNATETVGVSYRTHVQNAGWEEHWTTDAKTSGTEGQSLRLEGIQIKLTGNVPEGAGIEYKTHVQNQGWESNWAADGNTAGTEGQSLRLEGIMIRLVNMPGYSVEYRTHVQNVGWETNWSSDGDVSGTYNQSLRLEGIQIRIVKDGTDLTEYNQILTTVKNTVAEEYTAYSWGKLKTILTSNTVTQKNSQTEVDEATAAIQEGLDALESVGDAKIYNTAGTFGSAGSTTDINQNVMIDVAGVTLQNLHIKGNLIISEKVGTGDATLNNVTVDGETFIRGGGENSIHINGGTFNKITVQKTSSGAVRIVGINVSGLAVVISEDANAENLILEGTFATVQVNAPNMKILTQGSTVIGKMTITKEGAGSTVTLDTDTRVDQIMFNGKANIKGQGRIVKAVVNADSVTYEKAPEQQTVASTVKILPKIPAAVAVTGIIVTGADNAVTVVKGMTIQMSAAVKPDNATNSKVTWSVASGTGSATITDTGLLSGVSTGTVTVKAIAQDGTEKYGEKILTIKDPGPATLTIASSIVNGKANPNMIVTLTNDTFTATAAATANWTMTPGATGLAIDSITRDSDTQVTIKMTGTAVPGTLALKAKAAALNRGAESNEVSLIVQKVSVTDIAVAGTVGASAISTENGTLQMVASVTPTTASNPAVTWSVAKGTGTASISSTGLLTAVTDGTVTVRATALDGSLKYGEQVITLSNQLLPALATTSTIANWAADPTVVVTLTNDTFAEAANLSANWACSAGTTGLGIDTVTRNTDTQVTIKLKGSAAAGTLTLQAKEGAIISGTVSNLISLTVPGGQEVIRNNTDVTQDSGNTGGTGLTFSFIGATKTLAIDANNTTLPYYVQSGTTPPACGNWIGVAITVPTGTGTVDTGKVTASVNSKACTNLQFAGGRYMEYISVESADLTAGKPYTWIINWGSGYAPETITINLTNVAGLVKTQAAPTGLAGTAPTTKDNNDGTITGTTAEMEYKLATAGDTAYKDCLAGQTTGLAAANYVVRLKAQTGYIAGDTATVTVSANTSVTSIVVTGATGAETVVKGRTLQMSAAVSPSGATNKGVTWIEVDGTGAATIDQNGLLTTSDLGTGNVTVKVVAKDGSLIEGTKVITITKTNVLDVTAAPMVDQANPTLNITPTDYAASLGAGGVISITGTGVPEHLNGAGTMGYWVGAAIKIDTSVADTAKIYFDTAVYTGAVGQNLTTINKANFDAIDGQTDYLCCYADLGNIHPKNHIYIELYKGTCRVETLEYTLNLSGATK